MKIGVIAPYSRPFDESDAEGSGQNIFIRESSQAFAKAGNNVVIFRRASRATDREINFINKKFVEKAIIAGPKMRLGRDETYNYCKKINFLKEVDIRSFDFFIAHYWISEAWASQILQKSTKRVFYFPHSLFINPYGSASPQSKKLSAELKLANRAY